MELILVSDIFGKTPALEAISKTLSQIISKTKIIDPYNGSSLEFENEECAYKHFMDNVGINKYQKILKKRLKQVRPNSVLVGFSVGASAIWKISNHASFPQIKKAFCFYGSQIRHQTDIQPLFDIELIFPKKEPHFDVDIIIKCLNQKNCVAIKKASCFHGFMNKLSANYNSACYAEFIDYLKMSLIHIKSTET